ncbi:hypothetical protein ACKFKG_08930 [Phormidesmis sp. 146-35]
MKSRLRSFGRLPELHCLQVSKADRSSQLSDRPSKRAIHHRALAITEGTNHQSATLAVSAEQRVVQVKRD